MNFPDLSLPFQDPVLVFATVMLIVFLAPMLFRLIKVPGLVGHIVAGIIVGPYALGVLQRGSTMELLGTVGLLFLMFIAGLEIDLNKFEKLKGRSIVFGLFSFFIPQIGALIVGIYLLDFDLYSALLLGSIVGSHTLLAYPVAERIGITKNKAITMTMGGTIVTDTLSLLILAVVAGAVTGDIGPAFWLTFISLVSVYTFVMMYGLPRLGRWFFKDTRNDTNTEFVFLVTVLFLASFIADFVGLAAIIGAFLAGLSLNRLVPGSSPLMSRIQFVGNTLFIPFFLISTGMLVDVSVLIEGTEIWVMAGLFTGLVLVGKFLAATVISKIYGYTAHEQMSIFGLSVAQAAATLAVTLVGYDIELFSADVVNAVVIMILLTCLVGPWLTEKFGRKLALEEQKKPYQPSEAPQRILVPLANPVTSQAMIDLAMIIRDENTAEPIFPLTVAPEKGDVEAQVAATENMLGHAVVHAAAADVPVTPVTRVDMNIANGIMRAAKELRISDIIIGWNGEPSAKQRIFGSILDRVLEESKQLILVSRIVHPINTSERIILAIPENADRERGFAGAIRDIKNIINELGAQLIVFSPENMHSSLSKVIEHSEPELEVTFLDIKNWSNLISNKLTIDENDLFVLLSSREGSISWDKDLERLPGLIAERYPNNNFLTVYPNEQEAGSNVGVKLRIERTAQLPDIESRHIAFDLNAATASDALTQMLNPHFGDKPDVLESLTKNILNVDPDNLPGDIPGVAITKIRSSFVNEPTLFLGISPQGITYPGLKEEVHLIFLLISPRTVPYEKSLKMLAKLASHLSEAEAIDHIKNAKTIKEISTFFKDGELKT
ncbi:MAG: cation:proton antiporter [Bacteroidota bacterium]